MLFVVLVGGWKIGYAAGLLTAALTGAAVGLTSDRIGPVSLQVAQS